MSFACQTKKESKVIVNIEKDEQHLFISQAICQHASRFICLLLSSFRYTTGNSNRQISNVIILSWRRMKEGGHREREKDGWNITYEKLCMETCVNIDGIISLQLYRFFVTQKMREKKSFFALFTHPPPYQAR
jgi:hypothetical protein